MNRFSTLYSGGTPAMGAGPEKRWWSLRDMLARRGDRKGKTTVTA
jgi:hypothetical protein